MKIEQKRSFEPVVITLESKSDLSEMWKMVYISKYIGTFREKLLDGLGKSVKEME